MFIATSCSNGKKSINDTSSKNPNGKIKIEYWHVNADTQGGKTVEELVKKFNSENDHIEVTAVYNPDMYKGLMKNLQAEVTSGNPPAVVQIGWAFLDYFSNNFEYSTPQSVIDKYFPEDKNYLKDNFLGNILDLSKNSKGENAGIAYSLSTPVLYYNKDIFKAAGLGDKVPETWEQVIEYAKTIKDKTGKYGLYVQEPADFWGQQAIIESNGASMLSNNGGKVQASFASPEGIKAFQAYADMVLKDKSALHTSW
ncbi:MAG TPA: ABC transporter substrate-binding protein, partial [Clostridiaceae bacterium]|nr:ABC transporter substrate-binding protein [Clostridiaceae bacterium]